MSGRWERRCNKTVESNILETSLKIYYVIKENAACTSSSFSHNFRCDAIQLISRTMFIMAALHEKKICRPSITFSSHLTLNTKSENGI
jgi:hypothetical protein